MSEFDSLYIHGWHRKCWGPVVRSGVTTYRDYGRTLRNGKGLSAAELWARGNGFTAAALWAIGRVFEPQRAEVEL